MDIKKYVKPVIGAAAFIIGGIMARETAFETFDVLDNKFNKKKSSVELDLDD